MSILQKPKSWLSPLVALLVFLTSFAFVVFVVDRVQALHRIELGDELETVLKSTEGSVHLWKTDTEADVAGVANIPRVKSITRALAQRKSDRQLLLKNLSAILKPTMVSHGYLGFSLLFRDGKNGIRVLGSTPIFDELFPEWNDTAERALSGRFALGGPVRPAPQRPISRDAQLLGSMAPMIAAFPVSDTDGKQLGAIAFWLDAFGTFTQATQLGRLGDSGETYGVDAQGYMITRSRFGTQIVKLNEPSGPALSLTKMASSLVKHESGIDLDGYRDYRGVPTVGVWSWDPGLNMGFATELNQEEADRSLVIIRRAIWTIFGMFALATGGVFAFYEARRRAAVKARELEQTVDAQNEVLGTVSHDLKNPLNALLLTNEILLKTLPLNTDFTDRRRKLLESSRQAALRMKELITDLLDTSNIQGGSMHLHPDRVAPVAIVRRVVGLVSPLAAEKEIEIRVDVAASLPALLVDQSRIVQVFSNLLGNAIKFLDRGGKITVHAEQKNDRVEFSVADNGPGISEENLPHLFERFWQAEKTAKLGTGLGLSICREIILAHGGKIWAKSKVGFGSTFFFTLPTVDCVDAPLAGKKSPGEDQREETA